MTLLSENIKKTSADFRQYFDFLIKDFGLRLYSENYSGDKYVRVLRNDFIQVELAGDQSYFHAELRRLINNEPQPYSDEENNIGFESLAVLATNNNYDHFDFYPGIDGWNKVLENTAKLFKKSKEVFLTNKWVDIQKLEKLKDDEFFEKFNFRPSENKNKPTFFGLVKNGSKILLDKGFKLTLDSTELAPYHEERRPEKLVFKKFFKEIKISQRDWRDTYFIYDIEVNGRRKFGINLLEYDDIQKAADVFIEELRRLTE